MDTTWGIIGLGWLGSELATELHKQNYKTWGTHSKDFNFQTDPFPELSFDVLFLNTPPLPHIPAKAYADKIPKVPGSKIIFISSTSVYGQDQERVTESSIPKPTSESALWLASVESLLFTKFGNALTVIRPGGLIGGQRHPVFSLSRKAEIPNGDAVINLIHRQDLIGICRVAASVTEIPIINAVTPYHPRKKDYYSQWAAQLNLPKLNFSTLSESSRQIDSAVLPKLYRDWICPRLDFL
ncbi:MAG: SDR family NAD(P)-dependent oxidoreductase [Bdellovibrionaceae bacterium]|nr:SDR family NAD(P)-dependent oxidoreductase [Pseudobdellovibrionaceae bacterium]